MMQLGKLFCSGFVLFFVAWAFPAQAREEIPLEYFALRDVVGDAAISPDGKYLALLKIPTKDGDPVLEIYQADDLDKDPFVVSADPMEITRLFWVTDDDLVIELRQKVKDIIDGFNEGVYRGKVAYLNMTEKKLKSFGEVGLGIVHGLPDKPNKILVSFLDSVAGDDRGGAKLKEAFRQLAYYEMDLKTGGKKLLIRGKLDKANYDFGPQGNPLFVRGSELRPPELVWYHRPPGTKDWREMYRQHEDDFTFFEIEGLDYPREDYALVRANNGHDKIGLWSFNLKTNEFDELIYRREDVDVYAVRYHSNRWTHPNQVVGVMYYTDKLHVEYFDEMEGAMYAQLEKIIPWAHNLTVVGRSRDDATMLIFNIGPRDPGTYYMLKDGHLQAVGSRQPLIKSELLADVRYIKYKSRDGKTIPAYLTVPEGEKPFPLIVMPHGGPFIHERVSYDEWAQMLASRGYLVLQPEYRGSAGYGLDFYMIGFKDGGQGGYKMQDDKDDGALYLVKEGWADPDRLAMYGWSYGGYAALVAASRTPQIYQCVIAGAAVSDTQMQVNYYRYRVRGALLEEQTKMWDTSLSPINEAEKVNVPMLLVHGDVDQRVPLAHVKKYLKLLKKHDKPHKYVELEGADHFSNTLFYDHQKTLYTSVIDYLENDCGPGGL